MFTATLHVFITPLSTLIPFSYFLLLYLSTSSLQATPRLSEDKVKQCIDPRLKGDYPPKGIAKVSILSLSIYYIVFLSLGSLDLEFS